MDLIGQFRNAKRMRAYVAGSNKILVQVQAKRDTKYKRILVFDRNGYQVDDLKNLNVQVRTEI